METINTKTERLYEVENKATGVTVVVSETEALKLLRPAKAETDWLIESLKAGGVFNIPVETQSDAIKLTTPKVSDRLNVFNWFRKS